MKQCQNCGAQLDDSALFCNECGTRVSVQTYAPEQPQYQAPPVNQQPVYQQQYQQQPVYQQQYQQQPQPVYQQPVDDQSGLKTAAKVFMVLGCVATGWTLIALAWTIPMTVTVFHRFRDNQPVGTGLKVCSLLFVSLIGGILLLCVKNPQPQQQQYY